MIFFRRTLVALLLSCAAQLSAQVWPGDSALKATLQSRVRTPAGIGIVVATVEKGKPPKIFSAGSSGSASPLDGNTVFEIGSITKTFTSALLADMVQRGEVKLDDAVSRFLPATVHVPSRGGKTDHAPRSRDTIVGPAALAQQHESGERAESLRRLLSAAAV